MILCIESLFATIVFACDRCEGHSEIQLVYSTYHKKLLGSGIFFSSSENFIPRSTVHRS